MLYLITGLPGNGKTLYTIATVLDREKNESRTVYYNGIPDLTIDSWVQFDDPEKWDELPSGAIIVIDEAQRAFRPRGANSKVPPHVSALETHRHKGYDIYLITQHPSLIDQNVRRLSGTHRHIQRTFGMSSAFVHEWGEVHMDCERRRRDSSKTRFTFPKKLYGVYKSADQHTHKVALPKQVYLLFFFAALLVFLGYRLFTKWSDSTQSVEDSPPEITAPVKTHVASSDFLPDKSEKTDAEKTLEYLKSYIPRIEGFPHTAPRYDKITEPVEAPVLSGCVEMSGKCSCFTQRGTRLQTAIDACRGVVSGNLAFYDHLDGNGRPVQSD